MFKSIIHNFEVWTFASRVKKQSLHELHAIGLQGSRRVSASEMRCNRSRRADAGKIPQVQQSQSLSSSPPMGGFLQRAKPLQAVPEPGSCLESRAAASRALGELLRRTSRPCPRSHNRAKKQTMLCRHHCDHHPDILPPSPTSPALHLLVARPAFDSTDE
jgi:hypothetical protein